MANSNTKKLVDDLVRKFKRNEFYNGELIPWGSGDHYLRAEGTISTSDGGEVEFIVLGSQGGSQYDEYYDEFFSELIIKVDGKEGIDMDQFLATDHRYTAYKTDIRW